MVDVEKQISRDENVENRIIYSGNSATEIDKNTYQNAWVLRWFAVYLFSMKATTYKHCGILLKNMSK